MFERKACLRLSALSLALMAATGHAKQEDEKLSQPAALTSDTNS